MTTVHIFNDRKQPVVSFKSNNVQEDIKEFSGFTGWYYTTEGERLRVSKTMKNRVVDFWTVTSKARGYKRTF